MDGKAWRRQAKPDELTKHKIRISNNITVWHQVCWHQHCFWIQIPNPTSMESFLTFQRGHFLFFLASFTKSMFQLSLYCQKIRPLNSWISIWTGIQGISCACLDQEWHIIWHFPSLAFPRGLYWSIDSVVSCHLGGTTTSPTCSLKKDKNSIRFFLIV